MSTNGKPDLKTLGDIMLFEGTLKELRELTDQGVVFQLTMAPLEAMALIGASQLALRHPGFSQQSSSMTVKAIIEDLFTQLAEHDKPHLSELIRRGWHQEYD